MVQDWLGSAAVWIPGPTDRHSDVLGMLIRDTPVTPALVSDAQIAALSIEHGLEVASADADFARFPGVRWYDPLRP